MKNRLLIMFALLFISIQVFSQKTGRDKSDSLLTVVMNANDDTSKVTLLNQVAIELKNNEPDSAIYYTEKAIALSRKLNYEFGIAISKVTAASIQINLGQVEKAMINSNDALRIYEQLLNQEEDYNKQKILLRKSAALNLLGIIFMIKGNDPEALQYLFAALKIREENGDELGMSYTENNLGIIYLNQHSYQEALDHYTKALNIRLKYNDKSGAVASYNNIGVANDLMNNYQQALKYYSESFKLAVEINDSSGIASSYTNIGSIQFKLGNYEEALKGHMAALHIYEIIGEKPSIALVKDNMGAAYIRINKFDLARKYLQESLALNYEIEKPGQLEANYSNLALLDSATGNFESALINYKLYILYRDSLFNEESTRKLVQSQMHYDFDKKETLAKAEQEKKDALAIKELQKQKLVRNAFISGFAIVLLFAAVFFTQRNKIKQGKKLSDGLLLNILPAEVAEELKAKGSSDARMFDEVTVMFTDFKGFTQLAEKLSPRELVAEIDTCFKAFDAIITKHNIEKIKTIGDSYMCAGGLPVSNATHAMDVVLAAREILEFMKNRKSDIPADLESMQIRIGVHTGPVVAGIVGIKKFAYDIWGDTVNIASRMESSGETGKVNISGSTYELIKNQFKCNYRGKVQAKNKGQIDMFFIEG